MKKILDEFCQTTGMHPDSVGAIRLLARPRPRLAVVGRGRPRRYGPEVTEALVKLWEVGDRMCGKLLAAVLILVLVETRQRTVRSASSDPLSV